MTRAVPVTQILRALPAQRAHDPTASLHAVPETEKLALVPQRSHISTNQSFTIVKRIFSLCSSKIWIERNLQAIYTAFKEIKLHY